MKIGVNVEVMLVQVARRRRLKCSDWDGNPVDYLRGRVGNSSSRELGQDVSHLLVGCKRVQGGESIGCGRKLLDCGGSESNVRELISAVDEQLVLDDRAADVSAGAVAINSPRLRKP